MIWIILIIIIVLLSYINNNNNTLEHYDDRYTDTDFTSCAKLCRGISECYGFGYDREKNICYPARSTIQNKPLAGSLFESRYSKNHTTCNKVEPVLEPTSKVSFEQRRKNSVYACTEREGLQPQWYFFNRDKFSNIGEGKNLDEIFDVDEYKVKPYSWPINQFNLDQIDLLEDVLSDQQLTPKNITQVDRIKKVYGDTDKIIPNNQGIIYKNHKMMNSGEYMYPHKCVSNIEKKSCLELCSKDNRCVGVEFNKKFGPKYNVCCPYKTTGKYINRPNNYLFGDYYEKIKSDHIPKSDPIIIS